MLISLENNSAELIKRDSDEEFFNEAKVVILNEQSQKPYLINFLAKNKKLVNNDSKKISNNNNKNVFRYESIRIGKKTLNLYECSEVFNNTFC